jgi:hypothetical protein
MGGQEPGLAAPGARAFTPALNAGLDKTRENPDNNEFAYHGRLQTACELTNPSSSTLTSFKPDDGAQASPVLAFITYVT